MRHQLHAYYDNSAKYSEKATPSQSKQYLQEYRYISQ